MVSVNRIQGVLISALAVIKCNAKNASKCIIVREETVGVRCADLVKFVIL